MKVLVTGGAGYIGSHTVRQLVKTGADVTVLDNMVYGHAGALVDPEVKLVKGDLGDASVVYPLLMKGNFDAVIHFAAFINVGESVQNPLKYYMNNIARPLVLLGAMQAAGVKRFVFSSTCATYGVPTQIPIPETEKQDPINPYGSSKYMLEKVCRDCDRAWGLKSVFLRYFNASGCSEDGLIGEDHEPETHLIPNILLTLRDRSARSLGYMIYFFELACAISGYLLGVNPFNQPGVEAYKKNMFALLGKPGYEEMTASLKSRL